MQTISYLPILVGVKWIARCKTGYEVLLNTQFAHEERVPDIFRMHQQTDLTVHRYRHLSGDNIVLGIGIVRAIEAKVILCRLVDLFGMNGPNFLSGPG